MIQIGARLAYIAGINHAHFHLLHSMMRLARASTLQPVPLSLPPSQFWDDDNGKWSTFNIRVGTPLQDIRVLPATGQTSTIVVDSEVCQPDYDRSCTQSRGVTFNINQTSSFELKGGYEIGAFWEKPLGVNSSANYGRDTITLGFDGSQLPSLSHQTVGAVQSTRSGVYLGLFPLNPRPTNFTNFTDMEVSLLNSLRNHDTNPIPSVSWSYTAGCYNCGPGAFGSLVLGGYDSSMFIANDLTFPFGPDISADTMVHIRAISSNQTTEPLLRNSIDALISSLVPDLWLPGATCDVFQSTFGLAYDAENNVFTANSSSHSMLLSRNPSVTIELSPGRKSDAPSVEINFSYAQLFLAATAPRPEQANGTVFFPIRRAENETQYTLGRVFLQSAYLSVDFDRRVFNVSQAKLRDSVVPENLVAIKSPEFENETMKSSRSGLSTGTIVGMVVGIIVLVALLTASLLLYRRRKAREARNQSPSSFMLPETESNPSATWLTNTSGLTGMRSELSGSEQMRSELDARDVKDGEQARNELAGRPIRIVGGLESIRELEG